MRVSFITGCLMTTFVLATAPPLSSAATAADLDGEGYAEPPYDDGAYNTEEGDDTYGEPVPPRGSIKDGYPVPMPPPRAEAPPPPERYVERPPVRVERYACLERWEIRRRLRGEGWEGIRPMGGDGTIVRIRAHRVDTGRIFNLRVDRCSGAVLAARPEYLRSFAYRDDPWRY